LNGRKVDAEKGCMLKAEMAKKNLHTKRGLGEQQKNGGFSAYEAFYSVPPTHPYSNDLLLSPSTESNNDFYSDLLLMGSPPPSSVNSAFISRSHSVDARAADLFVKPSTSNNRFNIGRFPQASFSSDSLDYLSKSTPNDRNSFPLMNSFFNNNSNNHHHNSNTNNHKIASHPISPPLPPSTSTGLSRVIEEKFFKDSLRSPTTPISPLSSSPPTSGYRSLNNMILNSASSNPADQNPPCNTLYVGNLPPNTNEEELRLMFSKCLGYKRLSFKNKSNGPMCFVEFDDAIYAAQALQDLQGNPLSNSIKGGIRLSFSKNPLVSVFFLSLSLFLFTILFFQGVRQNPYTVNNNNSNNYFNNTFNSYRRESITTSAFDPQLS
jgi:hypothetical protein